LFAWPRRTGSWGYDRIVGALANLGHEISDQTVGDVSRRHGLPSAPARKHTTTWAAIIRVHLAVLAGTGLFHSGSPHRCAGDGTWWGLTNVFFAVSFNFSPKISFFFFFVQGLKK